MPVDTPPLSTIRFALGEWSRRGCRYKVATGSGDAFPLVLPLTTSGLAVGVGGMKGGGGGGG